MISWSLVRESVRVRLDALAEKAVPVPDSVAP